MEGADNSNIEPSSSGTINDPVSVKRTSKMKRDRNEEKYCSICDLTFVTKYNLVRHIKRLHNDRLNDHLG